MNDVWGNSVTLNLSNTGLTILGGGRQLWSYQRYFSDSTALILLGCVYDGMELLIMYLQRRQHFSRNGMVPQWSLGRGKILLPKIENYISWLKRMIYFMDINGILIWSFLVQNICSVMFSRTRHNQLTSADPFVRQTTRTHFTLCCCHTATLYIAGSTHFWSNCSSQN